MYSLRSQSCTAFFEEKAISVVDFFFMKKEEGYATNRSAVSYALLNNCKKVQHKNVIFPFMMLDIFDAVLKEARNSYYNLTKEVYISQREIDDDKEYVAKKLGVDIKQMNKFIYESSIHYSKYPNSQSLLQYLRKIKQYLLRK